MKAEEFLNLLAAAGYDFFTGVPCSIIGDVILLLEKDPRIPYVPAVREDVAVGIAAGAYLGGKTPCVLMQNSGLGQCLNALTSLNLIYKIPSLLIVTWRGYKGKDAPEHLVMGKACTKLMDCIGLPYRELSPKNVARSIEWSREITSQRQIPVALFLPRGVLE
ncbi:MAG TPA: thiamine pyrophosphate-binding protein [Candidatus Tripitaka sp. YC43]